MLLSYRHIKKYASQAGFALCGVARARVLSERAEGLFRAVGVDGALDYLARDPARRLDPRSILANARTIIVCAAPYAGQPLETQGGRISAHRAEGDYHQRLKTMLREIRDGLRNEFGFFGARVCCDTSAILEKAWAVEAGLGWTGRNSLLITPEFGSWVLLGEIVVDAECDFYDSPIAARDCGECRKCIDFCPARAISGGMVHSGRCISALTIERERRGLPPEPLNGWICGCDVCQLVCPQNRGGEF